MIKINPDPSSLKIRDGLVSAESRQGSKIEPVLLIHGTFANERSNEKLNWWEHNSDFCHQLDELFQEERVAARCWANIGTTFAWTGKNSELDRREAGRALAAQLTALEDDNGTERYHLIGHSHGGNVILNALCQLQRNPRKLGAVVFMGTPVLSFRHSESLDPRWIAIPLYIIALAGGIWALPYFGNIGALWITFVLVPILYAMLADFFLLGSYAGSLQYPQYGSGHPCAFVFSGHDEAINSLSLAQKIICDPGRFIDQFVSTKVRADTAVEPTLAPPLLSSQITRTGAYWLLSSSVPAEQLSGVERFLAQFRMRPLPDSSYWLLKVPSYVLFCCAILPPLIRAISVAVYSFTMRAVSEVGNRIGLRFAKILGRLVLKKLVRKAIFGEDQGRFLEIRNLPPGVSKTIATELSDEAEGLSGQLVQNTTKAMFDAIANGDAFEIKAVVADALTNTKLVHSHYYQSAKIRQEIAREIATLSQSPRPTPVPPWALWGHGSMRPQNTRH